MVFKIIDLAYKDIKDVSMQEKDSESWKYNFWGTIIGFGIVFAYFGIPKIVKYLLVLLSLIFSWGDVDKFNSFTNIIYKYQGSDNLGWFVLSILIITFLFLGCIFIFKKLNK